VSATSGETVEVALTPAHLHVFDAQSGINILAADAPPAELPETVPALSDGT
jgi:hypothetical protein